jgi:hypothetical protein
MNDTNSTVTARYLALGGAHVTVTKTFSDSDGEVQTGIDIACEACGDIGSEDDGPEHYSPRYAEQWADRHAAGCRKIPKRLWDETDRP